jgi:hypothetical protein
VSRETAGYKGAEISLKAIPENIEKIKKKKKKGKKTHALNP